MRLPKRLPEQLSLPVLFLSLVAGAYLLSKSSNATLSGLGSGLIAEFLGAAVTVFGIDYLIKRRDQKRMLPVKASSYEDIRLIVCWALQLWHSAYSSSVNDCTPSTWEELLSDTAIRKICIGLDISKPANIIPPMDWGGYVDHELTRIQELAEKILERHSFILEPDVYAAIYNMVRHGGANWRVSAIRNADHLHQTPRPTNLGSYFPVTRQWFDAVLSLHGWLASTHGQLIRNGLTNVLPPTEFHPFSTARPLPAAFEQGVLEEQIMRYQAWQKQP